MSNIYSKTYDWSDFTVRESNKGYIIESNSRVQGCATHRKVLIRFSEQFPKGLNLNEECGTGFSWGDYIFHNRDFAEIVLRKGIEVK